MGKTRNTVSPSLRLPAPAHSTFRAIMASLGNQDFRKFIDESRNVGAQQKKAKPKPKKKERPRSQESGR